MFFREETLEREDFDVSEAYLACDFWSFPSILVALVSDCCAVNDTRRVNTQNFGSKHSKF